MTSAMGRTGALIVLFLSLALVVVGTRVSDGFFLIDESIYFIGADALHRTGSLAVQNGLDKFLSPDLGVSYLVNGPLGLVPQYPVGLTLTGAPLIGFFGQRSFIILNVLAGIGTLFATHAITRRLFGSREAANISVALLALCTFWPEYAVGQWPHSIAVLFTSLAFLFFLIALDREERVVGVAALSGAAIGTGMFFRLEAVLLLPGFVAVAILFARRPLAVLLGGVAAFVPAVALMALSNKVRFGTWNPLTYGSSGGGTDASSYLVLGVILVVALGGLTAMRLSGGLGRRAAWLAAGAAVAGLGALALSPYASLVGRIGHGAYALLIDSTALSYPRSAVHAQGDGTVLFWGLPKKALGQSMPWLGCLTLLAGAWRDRTRRNPAIVLIIFATWSLPFLSRSWYGGFGSNMRYFLSTLPLLAALSGWLILDLWRRTADHGPRLLVAGVFIGIVVAAFWMTRRPEHIAELHQFVSLGVLTGIAALCLLAALVPRQATAGFAFLSVAVGLGLSSVLSYLDFNASQTRRTLSAAYSDAAKSIPGPVVFYSPPDVVSHAFRNPDQLVALPNRMTEKFDARFIDAACRSGYRILLLPMFVDMIREQGYRVIGARTDPSSGAPPFSELVCRP